MASASVQVPSSSTGSNPWILDSWRDLLLIVAAPLVVLLGILLAKLRWSGDEITTFALVCAIGHHLPGMMRAYGDRALFHRFRVRFIVAPLFLIAVATAATVWDLKGVLLVAAGWGWWHYLAQAYGFMRIYDGKVGSLARVTRWLDKAMCLAWFAAAVVLTRNALPVFLDLFYKCGGPFVSAAFISGLRMGVAAMTAVVTLLFVIHVLWSYLGARERLDSESQATVAKGSLISPSRATPTKKLDSESQATRPPSAVKLLLMASTFGYYWYSLATIENVLVAYALFELFHDVQYLTIVWAFNRGRAARDPSVGAFTKFLFRQRGGLVLLYVALVFAYGSLDYGAKQFSSGLFQRALLGVFLASTLLHYYYDGFIWRLREDATRQPLGLKEGGSQAVAPVPTRPAWKHAAGWAVFVVPVLVLSGLQLRGSSSPEERWQSIAAVVPDNAQVHFNLAVSLEENQNAARAADEYRRALAIHPDYEKAHYNLAGLLARQGQTGEAITHYEAAVKLRPHYGSAHNNLGGLRLQRGDFSGAIADFERALACEPRNRGFALNLALAHFHFGRQLEQQGDPAQAARHYEAAVQLNPQDAALLRDAKAVLAPLVGH